MFDELYEHVANEGWKDFARATAVTAGLGAAALGIGKVAQSDHQTARPASPTTRDLRPAHIPGREEPKVEPGASRSVEREFGSEYPIIKKAALRNGVKPGTEDFAILLAIRKAENGKAGREFGVLHPRAVDTNLDTQAGWAAATIRKNRERWKASEQGESFIEFLGKRYCPVGAENDPNQLNQHWIKNVQHWTEKFRNM